jgi:hypothetical protein
VTTVDQTDALGPDVSGLDYEGSGSATPGVLWAVDNGEGLLLRLVWNGTQWVRDTTNDWSTGKTLRYPGGGGQPDSEGVALTDAGAAGGVYVSSERDSTNNAVSRPSVLRYDVSPAGTTLTAEREWNLTADLPVVGQNAGIESVVWVPDTYLVASGFVDEATAALYNPATYANHGTGLFFVGLEANGAVYAYALDQTSGSFNRVATFASGFPTFGAMSWDAQAEQLWVVCDNNCEGRSAVFKVDTAAGATQGRFVPLKQYDRPTGMPNLNNEGFTTTPASECVGGSKPVFWADDGNTDGNVLRAGTIACGPGAPAASTTGVAVTPTTITATVATVATGAGGAGTPTGTVAFTVDGAAVGTAPLAAGLATLAFDVPSGGARTVVATYSGDGSFTTSSGTVVRRDPGITAAASSTRGPSSSGWYGAPVTVTFTCTPDGAPVPCPAPVVLRTSGADQTVSGTAEAADGGAATATLGDIDIDLVAPKVKVRGVKAGKVYKGSAPKPKCKATDALSGVATCKLKKKTKKLKKHRGTKRTVTATATDRAGNVTKAKTTYRVVRKR